MAHLSVSVFGGFRVSKANALLTAFESDKVRALLAYLVVESGRAHRRETLAGLFWPDCSEETARHNLSQALFNLRKVIGDPTANPTYLQITRETIQFNSASDYSLDLEQFHASASAGENRQRPDASSLARIEQMVDCYRGEFLHGFSLKDSPEFEEWVLVQRATVHQQVMAALVTLADEYEKRGELPSARRCCERQLALDPWREEAHSQRMRLLALEGQRSAALAQYETCKRILADEFGVEPDPKTRDLYEQIRLGTFPPKPEPPAKPAAAPTPKLPLPLTPFLGRENELVELAQMIENPPCRCISLIGPGGIGKTRLALEAAERNRNRFRHGAVFIPLASVETADAVVRAIASGIGFAFSGSTDPKKQLIAFLTDKNLLLILDNVEHFLAQAANQAVITDLIIEILQQAPQVKLLITSREVLNIGGEWVCEVRGLDFPEGEPVDAAGSYSSMALFLQHARRVRPGFETDTADQKRIARLCRLVEGMPLAIELAAAWVRLLSTEEIVSEVERSLDFLNTQMRDIPARHRSMRAVFEPSWQMLPEEEKHVLRRLSVFRGSFTRQAAAQVAEASLLALSSLVIHSLVRRTKAGCYDIHELIRQYAASKLAEDPAEQQQTQSRHCAYYLGLLEGKDVLLHSPEQKTILNELSEAVHNIRAAWDWAVHHQKIAFLYRASFPFRHLFEMRNWFREGELAFTQAAQAIPADRQAEQDELDPQMVRSVMQAHSGFFMFRQGKSAAAYAAVSPCLEQLRADALRTGGDPLPLIYTLVYLGIVCWELGKFSEAVERLEEGLECTQTPELRWFQGHMNEFLGIVAMDRGEYEQARQYLRRALDIFRQLGDPVFTAHALSYLGRTVQALGEQAEAENLLRESLKIAGEIGYSFGRGLALDALGQLVYAQGAYRKAQECFQESANLFHAMGDNHRLARSLNHQGMTALALGQVAEAQDAFQTAFTLAREGGLIPVVLAALAGWAAQQAQQGSEPQTLELVLSILQHPQANQETKDLARGVQTRLEAELPPQTIEDAHYLVGEKDVEIVDQSITKRQDISFQQVLLETGTTPEKPISSKKF